MSEQAKTEAGKFTARELELLGYVMLSLKSGPPDVDYDKLASLAGMTNPASAGNAWRAIKKKLFDEHASNGTPKSTPKKPATPRKRKTAADEDDNDKKDDKEEATPKKKRGRPAKAKKEDVKKEDVKKEANVKEEEDGAKGVDEGAGEDTAVESMEVALDDGDVEDAA